MLELRALQRYKAGIEGLDELVLRYAEIILAKFLRIRTDTYKSFHARKIRKLFRREDAYHIKEVMMPLLDDETERAFFYNMFYDTFTSYCYFEDKYDEKTFDSCDKFLSEGLYGLVNDRVNVTVMPGDIVIDAGSWIGDFAAYASVKGATTYAFEPTDSTFAIL
ncbi:MAG: hypothetical protein IJG36_03110, partial [Synergistaceae bacterium]|nr:hypothetical protein [Synergistaceae bacterium]